MDCHNNSLEENKNLMSYAKINSRQTKDLKLKDLPRISKEMHIHSGVTFSAKSENTEKGDLSK